MKTPIRSVLPATLLAFLFVGSARAQERVPQSSAPPSRAQWAPEIVALFESLPIQEGGRVKPLHTHASFTLLRLNGKRSLRMEGGLRLTAVEWLLDVLFYPEVARGYPTFLVQNPEVVLALGVSQEGKKRRDRYSLDELSPGVERLFQLGSEYHKIEEKRRTSVQQQIFLLATNVQSYLELEAHLDFARRQVPIEGDAELAQIFGGSAQAPVSGVIERMGPLLDLRERLAGEHDEERFRAVTEVLVAASELTARAESLALIPPDVSAPVDAPWLTPADAFFHAFHDGAADADAVRELALFEGLVSVRDDRPAFESKLRDLHGRFTGRATARGDYQKVALELGYYKSKVLAYSHYGFVLAFLLMAGLWLRPRNRAIYGATSLAVLVSTLLLVGAITVRCLIRGRPPVSTLYETVLFVTAVGALIAMFIELINRRRIAISAAALVGMVGLFIANGYEMLDKRDTMPSLVAVLDTNFWLATHVTAITTGYSAGMLAALLASIYIVAKAVGWRRSEPGFYKSLGKMVYGVLCFAMIFSTVGTILGGIWANDSWGRFWGWDPKENGALLIVLSQLVILHARMGGYLREHGVCMAAAFGGTVIAFSWWGVNLLGVGLHSYGFTSGISKAVWTYYLLQWGIVGLGGFVWLLERERTAARASAPVPARHERSEQLEGAGV
jgi:ABC-type transport system involved in cytochrome c biogenesis permease subunit